MAAETSYIVVEYDNEASGPFVANDTICTWPGGSGQIVTVIDNGTTGKLHIGLVSGDKPTNNETLTQGSTTADTNGPAPNGDSEDLLYPAFFREDVAVSATGNITWTGEALGATHSFYFDAQTSNVVVGEILTFSPGNQQCEVVTVISDAGATGELAVRWITFLDTLEFPGDNDTFTGDIAGDGTLNGVVHPRAYSPLHLHRLLADLNDDEIFAGNDVVSVYNPTPSARSTDQIVELLGDVNITDTVAQHMFGGSVDQDSNRTQYSGLAVQVTDADDSSNPVVIQDNAIVTAYWENAYMPDSIVGKVRIMRKTREDGVNIDGKRVKAKLLEYQDTYFEGSTTLGQAETALALFSSPDGNNTTAVGTVAGAPYNSIVQTEGYQLIDYNNGAGAQPYAYEMDFGSATSPQAYERTKYIQRRGTAETLFNRNAQLFTGVTLNWAFDANTGAWNEGGSAEECVWGTEVPYTMGGGTAAQVWQVEDSPLTFSDQTTGFNDATDANCTPFPATEAVNDYFAIGFSEKFDRVTIDYGSASAVAGVGGAVAWEYWNGSQWTAVSGLSDGTTGFTAAKADGLVVSWTMPTDWKKATLNAVEEYYIRARVTTVYTTNPVLDQGFIGATTSAFTANEVVIGITSGARGRILWDDTTGNTLILAQDSGGANFSSTEDVAGAASGAVAVAGTVVTNANAGSMQVLAISGSGATGNIYGQRNKGTAPANNQTTFGVTSGQTADVNVTVQTRVINNQYIGNYTGSAYNPANFGIAIDPTDAIASDLFTDLLGANQQPPNNQIGTVTSGVAGDYLFVYAWDGTSVDVNGDPEPDFDEMTLNGALTAGVSTSVVVNGTIPDNTPQVGNLRIQRDSDSEYDLVPYSSHDGTSTFTLVGTAPSNAANGNQLFRSPLDKTWATTGVDETYTAVYSGTPNSWGVRLTRGGVNPIKPFPGSASFGATGFTVAVQRIADA